VIEDSAGADVLNLTSGSDAFFLHDAISGFHSSVSLSKDAYGNQNKDRITNIETINGGSGDDIIDITSPDTQLSYDMVINGEDGDDVIWASSGKDTLNGGDGNDVLFGGKGIDTLTGGKGADTFEFEKDSGNDVIKDYSKSEGDILRLYIQSGDEKTLKVKSSNSVEWGSLSIELENTYITKLDDLNFEFISVI